MAEQEEVGQANLTDVLQSGMLTNPSDTALFKADDVKQGPITVTIRGFQKRAFTKDGKTENAWIVVFEEDVPGLKLNLTRQEQLYTIMGTARIDEMIGRPITMAYDADVKFGAKKVGGIRLERAEDLTGMQ